MEEAVWNSKHNRLRRRAFLITMVLAQELTSVGNAGVWRFGPPL